MQKIALVALHATINIIRDYNIVEKQRVQLPKMIEDDIKCANPACISNEPVQARFYVKSEDPLLLKGHYCGYIVEKKGVLEQF